MSNTILIFEWLTGAVGCGRQENQEKFTTEGTEYTERSRGEKKGTAVPWPGGRADSADERAHRGRAYAGRSEPRPYNGFELFVAEGLGGLYAVGGEGVGGYSDYHQQ
jgi:hypothetical protein